VTERGVAIAQAARDLDLAESVLRRWIREAAEAPITAFPGNGQQRAELAEIAALKTEVAKLKAEPAQTFWPTHGPAIPNPQIFLGELIAQGKSNLHAPWLGISAFVSLSIMLTLLVFVGEAVRDAFDPRKN